jgi:hypothetical protein
MHLVLSEMSVLVQASYPQTYCSFEAVKCLRGVRFSGLVVAFLS